MFNVGSGVGTRLIDMARDHHRAGRRAAASNIVPWPALAEQIETGDFVADVSRIRRELGWEPRVVAARMGCDGRSRSIGRTWPRDGAPRARRVPRSRLHGRRRRRDGAQPGPASSRRASSRSSAASRGWPDRRGDPADRRTPVACSVSIPACGGRGTCSRHPAHLRETSPTSCTRSCSPPACTVGSPRSSRACRS